MGRIADYFLERAATFGSPTLTRFFIWVGGNPLKTVDDLPPGTLAEGENLTILDVALLCGNPKTVKAALDHNARIFDERQLIRTTYAAAMLGKESTKQSKKNLYIDLANAAVTRILDTAKIGTAKAKDVLKPIIGHAIMSPLSLIEKNFSKLFSRKQSSKQPVPLLLTDDAILEYYNPEYYRPNSQPAGSPSSKPQQEPSAQQLQERKRLVTELTADIDKGGSKLFDDKPADAQKGQQLGGSHI